MNTQNILTASALDILFEGRNKNYGAYELRKNYNQRLTKALVSMLCIALLFTMGSIFAKNKKGNQKFESTIDVELSSYKEKKKEEIKIPKEQPRQQQQKQFAQIAVNIPVIAPDKEVNKDNDIKPVEATKDVKIGAANFTGENAGADIIGAPSIQNSVTGDNGAGKPLEDDYSGAFTTVEITAQFPGGLVAWKKYLERNLNASLPAENGAQPGKYTVIVSFVVDNEGNISDVKAENAPGFGTEAEAIKIIKKGPKWVPAIQNGRKVAYRAKQQVTFVVDDNG